MESPGQDATPATIPPAEVTGTAAEIIAAARIRAATLSVETDPVTSWLLARPLLSPTAPEGLKIDDPLYPTPHADHEGTYRMWCAWCRGEWSTIRLVGDARAAELAKAQEPPSVDVAALGDQLAAALTLSADRAATLRLVTGCLSDIQALIGDQGIHPPVPAGEVRWVEPDDSIFTPTRMKDAPPVAVNIPAQVAAHPLSGWRSSSWTRPDVGSDLAAKSSPPAEAVVLADLHATLDVPPTVTAWTPPAQSDATTTMDQMTNGATLTPPPSGGEPVTDVTTGPEDGTLDDDHPSLDGDLRS